MRAPMPAGSSVSTTIWEVDLPGKVVIRPVAIYLHALFGRSFRRENALFQITASMRAFWSLMPK